MKKLPYFPALHCFWNYFFDYHRLTFLLLILFSITSFVRSHPPPPIFSCHRRKGSDQAASAEEPVHSAAVRNHEHAGRRRRLSDELGLLLRKAWGDVAAHQAGQRAVQGPGLDHVRLRLHCRISLALRNRKTRPGKLSLLNLFCLFGGLVLVSNLLNTQLFGTLSIWSQSPNNIISDHIKQLPLSRVTLCYILNKVKSWCNLQINLVFLVLFH